VAKLDEGQAYALAAMREWHWISGDPDGNTWPIWKDINDVVNRLAMEGIERPQNVLIALLSHGHLIAEGDYRWRKYQWRRHYSVEEIDKTIQKRQWQNLADLIEYERLEISSNGGLMLDYVELTNLGKESCYPYDCDLINNRFSTYLCPPDTYENDREYFEEWFSAWHIKVHPAKLDFEFDESEAEPAETAISRGGRSAAKWWPAFAEELAMFIHEEGIPDGVGHEGQSEILDKIFTRLNEANKMEPGRATVQPVINAVLARIRSAGN